METPQQLFLNIRNSLQGVVHAMGQLYGPSVSYSVSQCLANTELYLARVETLITENARKTDMALHPSAFEYLKPNEAQISRMAAVRGEFAEFVHRLDVQLPDGPDKTYVIRKLRECAMWANVCITREADATPRKD